MNLPYLINVFMIIYVNVRADEDLITHQCTIPYPLFGKVTDQSSTAHGGIASRAIDGDTNQKWEVESCTHTIYGFDDAWWMVDFGESVCVCKVEIFNRNDCCSDRINGSLVHIGNNANGTLNPVCRKSPITESETESNPILMVECDTTVCGRYLSIRKSREPAFALCEVKVYKRIL
ncbi:fucolectin-like [Amphiura filiformis]|uniref:fucolectin-like n=1 Tax=Amphiura filiformis TaxID=82378 RepID=UPI003B21F072